MEWDDSEMTEDLVNYQEFLSEIAGDLMVERLKAKKKGST